MNSSPRFSPLLILFFGILAASTGSLLIRLVQAEVPSLVIAAGRLSLATLILLPLTWRHSRLEWAQLTRRQVGLLLLSGLFLAFHFATWVSSLEFTSVASSAVLVATIPLWVALLSPLVLKEHLTRLSLLGLGIALAGGVLVGLSETCQVGWNGIACTSLDEMMEGQSLWGNFLALAGAWFGAGYLLVGRKVRSRLSLNAYITAVYGTAALVLLVWVAAARQSLWGYSWMAYLGILALALVPQLLGHTSFNWALRFLPAAFVSVALLGEPVGSSLLATFFLNEPPLPLEIMGGLITLVGIALVARGQKE